MTVIAFACLVWTGGVLLMLLITGTTMVVEGATRLGRTVTLVWRILRHRRCSHVLPRAVVVSGGRARSYRYRYAIRGDMG